MDNQSTCRSTLSRIIIKGVCPNNLFNNMACEACSVRFTIFKRKKQCKDCLRYYCAECIIRRGDRVLSCDNCSLLSRRPLIKSQVFGLKSKDLKQYLIAKKVSLQGCVEKEDLVNILMRYANGVNQPTNERTESTFDSSRLSNRRVSPPSPPQRSRSPPAGTRQIIESPVSESERPLIVEHQHDVVIEEVAIEMHENFPHGPEPLISEQEPEGEVSEPGQSPSSDSAVPHATQSPANDSLIVEEVSSSDSSPSRASPLASEDAVSPQEAEMQPDDGQDSSTSAEEPLTWTGRVKISDVKLRTDLERLNVRQLKELLISNRVDFRGCVERTELLDRVTRLWNSHQQGKKEPHREGQYDGNFCKICWDAPIECVILECGHLACCVDCGKQMRECPICRQYVVRVVRCFKA